jgi:hypothetical protein
MADASSTGRAYKSEDNKSDSHAQAKGRTPSNKHLPFQHETRQSKSNLDQKSLQKNTPKRMTPMAELSPSNATKA